MEQLINNEKIKQLLYKACCRDFVAHAYLFGGQEGTGKTAAARYFASLLLCENRQGNEPCHKCSSCLMLAAGTHPDYRELGTDGSVIKIEQIRELQDRLDYKTFRRGWRVFVIQQAEKMTLQAANSFLKTLEEPPVQTVFILLTTQPQLLPETIVSRCQIYHFRPAPLTEAADMLVRDFQLSQDEAAVYAALAQGCYGRAVHLVQETAELADEQAVAGSPQAKRKTAGGKKENDKIKISTIALRLEVKQWLEQLPRADALYIMALTDKISKLEIEQQAILDMLTFWLRDILIWQRTAAAELIYNRDQLPALRKLAQKYSVSKVIQSLETITEVRAALKYNANLKLTWEITLLQLAG